MKKKDNSLYKLGGISAIGAAVSSILFVIATLLDPLAQPVESDSMMMLILVEEGAFHYLSHGAFALTSLFIICTIPAISDLLRAENEGWIQIGAIFGYMGFGVMALTQLVEPVYELHLARAYLDGDAITQAAIMQVMTVASFDPAGWATFAPMGIWTFIAHWVAIRKRAWPKKLAYLGFAGALVYGVVLIASVFYWNMVAALFGLVGSLIIGPALYIWLGIFFIRKTKQPQEAEAVSLPAV